MGSRAITPHLTISRPCSSHGWLAEAAFTQCVSPRVSAPRAHIVTTGLLYAACVRELRYTVYGARCRSKITDLSRALYKKYTRLDSPTSYRDARTAFSLSPSAAQAAAQTATMYTHSTHSPKGPLACMVGSVRLTAPVSKLARRKTPSRWRFNAPKRSGAGPGQTRLVARQMHSTKRVCGEQAQPLGSRACSWARAPARLCDDPERVGQVAQPSRRPLHRRIGDE